MLIHVASSLLQEASVTERPNRDALNRAIDIYRDAMRPFITRNLRKVRGGSVEDHLCAALPRKDAQIRANLRPDRSNLDDLFDVNDFARIVGHYWRACFKQAFTHSQGVESVLNIVAEARNKAAHPGAEDVSAGSAEGGLEQIIEALNRINAPEQRDRVQLILDTLRAGPTPQLMPAPPEPEPVTQSTPRRSDLAPWREVIQPNDDVRTGAFQQAEFAADLQQVYDGRAHEAYANPVAFFNQTYITPGLRTLLVSTLRRISGRGGDPVIQTKTGFGGGKTHSLIALYHLVNSSRALLELPHDSAFAATRDVLQQIVSDAGLDGEDIGAEVSVLSGTYLSPTDTNTTEKGDPLNTLWGTMAYQLGGQEAYDIVAEAARTWSAPGGAQLEQLFERVGPCVILIDELVAYARNASDRQDNIYTFIQNLTESVRRSEHVSLVVTLPESSQEAGGEQGQAVLSRLDAHLGRIEAIWQPLEVHEAFEVVRRRLFGSSIEEAERDRTCQAFVAMYSRQRSDYPRETGETTYLQRMRQCYPIHPEIFDRLYQDWSSIHSFQRTRGVLRMLANCVSRLWLKGDVGSLIMPGDIPLTDPALAAEFTRLLTGNWNPVMSEVDSEGSRADTLDTEQRRFSDVGGAARRVTRTIFLGSAVGGAVKGVNEERIRLGVVQPGHGVSVYNDALNRLSRELYYLYQSDGRYYFHAEENLNKVAVDRANDFTDREVDEEIVGRLGAAVGRRADVIVCPDPNERNAVPEGEQVRLVVLSPSQTLPSRSTESDRAAETALSILQMRGDAPRIRKNLVVFLAAKEDEIRALRRETRRFLSWKSIREGERRLTTLTGDREQQVRNSMRTTDQAADSALVRAYRWALAPSQPDPNRANYQLSQFDCDPVDFGDLALAAFRKLIAEEAVVETIAPKALATMLEQRIWSSPSYGEHIAIDSLWDLVSSNVYLHRLRHHQVLNTAIDAGVLEGAFGRAAEYDSGAATYQDLEYRNPPASGMGQFAEDRPGLLVHPDMAELQIAETVQTAATDEPSSKPPAEQPTAEPTQSANAPVTTRVAARKTLHGAISLDQISQLQEEIIRNLSDSGTEITITIAIDARNSAGFSENTLRAVRENSEQLGVEFELPYTYDT